MKWGGKYMNCENYFCIYNKKEKCTLNEISLDFQGRCNECIYVNLEEAQLKKIKKEQLRRLDYD